MGKLRIAVATNGNDELKDVVSNFFGIANTFTIVDVENGKIENSDTEFVTQSLGSWTYCCSDVSR